MPAPACMYVNEHDGTDICQTEGFSQSVEHDNLWYCRKHYLLFLKEKPIREFAKLVALAKERPEIMDMLMKVVAAAGGKK